MCDCVTWCDPASWCSGGTVGFWLYQRFGRPLAHTRPSEGVEPAQISLRFPSTPSQTGAVARPADSRWLGTFSSRARVGRWSRALREEAPALPSRPQHLPVLSWPCRQWPSRPKHKQMGGEQVAEAEHMPKMVRVIYERLWVITFH